ncbi:glycosyltransferase [Candidatus Parcubacteria bacterium]|nr:glycosyltransferase [Candidatus Parcubacteria bacterium]
MNILQISTTDNKGGAAGIAWSIKKYLDKNGIKNSMFVRDKYSDEQNVFKIPNKFLTLSKIFKYILSNDIEHSNSDWILKTKEYKEADIIHCHNLHGYYFNLETLYKMSLEKKIVWTFHDMWPITSHCAYTFDSREVKNGFFTCPSRKIYPPILFNNDENLIKKKEAIYNKANFHIVCPSKWILNSVDRTVLKYKEKTLIYNGINLSEFQKYNKEESRKKLELPLDKKIILFIASGGKKNPFKGSEFVDELASEYKDNSEIIFLVAGSNNKKRKTKNNILFMPKIKEKELLSRLYSSADVLLNPTLADNLPTVILEAFACGLPVVTFNTGGTPEIVKHSVNGYIAKYKNIKQLKGYIDIFIKIPQDEYNQFSENALRKSFEFNQEKMFKSYINLYNEM